MLPLPAFYQAKLLQEVFIFTLFEIYIQADHCNSTELDSTEKCVLYLFRSSFFCIMFILMK